jgi:hypothetical protein
MNSELTIKEAFELGVPSRNNILELEQAVGELPDQIDLESMTTHHFAPGVYAREMFAAAGSVVVGKIHKHECLNVLLTGRILVATEFGNKEHVAPAIWKGEAGVKRAGYVLEDTRWINIHPNAEDTEDLTVIEESVIAPSYEAYDNLLEYNSKGA